jgi:ABC-type transport system involved in cytochrome bd biosynthesis fused ATPase/permease subunit
VTDLKSVLSILPKASKRLWWISVLCAVISNVFEIFAAGTFSIMVSSSLGGRKSNFGVLTSLIPFRLTLKILLLILFISFLGKLAFQVLELSLKTRVASSLFQSLFADLSTSARVGGKELFTSKAQNVKFLHDVIHNVFYPATLIISETVLLILFIPFVFLFAPKASFLIFGITALLTLPTVKLIGNRLQVINIQRSTLDQSLDSKLFDQARVSEDLGFATQHEAKMKETIRAICKYDRSIVQYGSYSRFLVEFVFIISVVTTFMFLNQLVTKESRVQFLAVLAYSFFRIVPAFSRIMSAKNSVYSHAYKLADLQGNSKKGDKVNEFTPYTFFKKSFAIKSSDGQLGKDQGDNIQFQRGDWLLIKAKTGVGKTTLLKKIGGITQSSYSVIVDGKRLGDGDVWHPKIGYVSQSPYLVGSSILEMVTGMEAITRENASLYQECIQIACLDRFERLEDLQLENLTLSGGQKKQVALARALFLEPSLLLLDEMTSGLDLPLAGEILSKLKISNTFDSLIMTTHESHFDSFFNRIIFLERSSALGSKKP